MTEETLDQISPILPIDFFSISIDLHHADGELKKRHRLPDFSELLFEESFADVFMGWKENGLMFEIKVFHGFEQAFFPNFRKGDSIELFIDTRDLKTAGFLTQFCHHFMILPKPTEGVIAQEMTVFRTDDRHELCDPEKIKVQSTFAKKNYILDIFIPSECLHGYDPKAFKRLGFAYQINRFGADPQHLVLSSDYFALEKQPSLWSSMEMKNS